jgi:hypothetical protein
VATFKIGNLIFKMPMARSMVIPEASVAKIEQFFIVPWSAICSALVLKMISYSSIRGKEACYVCISPSTR